MGFELLVKIVVDDDVVVSELEPETAVASGVELSVSVEATSPATTGLVVTTVVLEVSAAGSGD